MNNRLFHNHRRRTSRSSAVKKSMTVHLAPADRHKNIAAVNPAAVVAEIHPRDIPAPDETDGAGTGAKTNGLDLHAIDRYQAIKRMAHE
jgi:hypothetical protein